MLIAPNYCAFNSLSALSAVRVRSTYRRAPESRTLARMVMKIQNLKLRR